MQKKGDSMCNRNNHFTAEKIKLLPKTSIQCKKKTKNKKQKKNYCQKSDFSVK